jgi:tRNA dimethylallyltransferase
VPIVVGGTSYWIQHLVFSDRLIGFPQDPSTTTKSAPKNPEETQDLLAPVIDPELLHLFSSLPETPPSASSDADAASQLYRLLSAIDPIMASRWHWSDTRKVLRSLEIIKEKGRKASDIIAEQESRNAASEPRFRTLFFWLYAEPSILETRLYERVDKMIEV